MGARPADLGRPINLLPGTEYTFRVRAFNADGPGDARRDHAPHDGGYDGDRVDGDADGPALGRRLLRRGAHELRLQLRRHGLPGHHAGVETGCGRGAVLAGQEGPGSVRPERQARPRGRLAGLLGRARQTTTATARCTGRAARTTGSRSGAAGSRCRFRYAFPATPGATAAAGTRGAQGDEPATAQVSLSVSPTTVDEGLPVTVTATLSQALGADVVVPVTITAGTAEADDYGTLPTLTVSAGQTSAAQSMTTSRDADGDDDTFTVGVDTANLPASADGGEFRAGGGDHHRHHHL